MQLEILIQLLWYLFSFFCRLFPIVETSRVSKPRSPDKSFNAQGYQLQAGVQQYKILDVCLNLSQIFCSMTYMILHVQYKSRLSS